MSIVSRDSSTSNKYELLETAIDALFFHTRRQNIPDCSLLNQASLKRLGIEDQSNTLKDSIIVFSGESLAHVPGESREQFWDLLWALKEVGASLGFEPKYTPELWLNDDDAKFQFDLAFQIADFVLLDLHKFGNLYGLDDLNGLSTLFDVYASTKMFITKPCPFSALPKISSNDPFVQRTANLQSVSGH